MKKAVNSLQERIDSVCEGMLESLNKQMFCSKHEAGEMSEWSEYYELMSSFDAPGRPAGKRRCAKCKHCGYTMREEEVPYKYKLVRVDEDS